MTTTQKAWKQEGMEAFAAGELSQNCPYGTSGMMADRWFLGWWKAYYEQRDIDTKRIANWLEWSAPVELSMTSTQAQSIAYLVTTQGKYDRTQPITDNRIAGIAFDIPAPATLPDPPNIGNGVSS